MSLFYLPRAYGFDTNGRLMSGARLNFYEAGTSTRKNTFSDAALTTANSNPVIADSSGVFGPIFLGSGAYNVSLTNSSGVVMWTQDNITADAGSFSYNQGDTGAVDTTISAKLKESISVSDFGARPGNSALVNTNAFQAAINALPDAGGIVLVPEGDYSNVTPGSLTIATNKMVTWWAFGATLPAEMPGNVVVSGPRAQPHEGQAGAATRPGNAFIRFISEDHVPSPLVVNQQDSIVYVEGSVDDTAGSLDHEFAGVRSIMASTSTEADASIRSYHGTTVGDGGLAKVRGMRLTAIGLDGHAGVINGAMIAATRTGVKPVAFGGDGTTDYATGETTAYGSSIDYAIVGQAGPGIRGVFYAQGFSGKDTPQTVFAQGRGNQGLLPTVAVFDAHGGGTGLVLRVTADEEDPTVIASMDNAGRMLAPAYRSGNQTIADDATFTVTPPSPFGFLEIYVEDNIQAYGKVYYRATASASCAEVYGGTAFGVSTSDLTGTTGVDGDLTVSAKADGTIEIENRTGATRVVVWHFIARS